MTQDVQIEHHSQKGEQGKNNEELHSLGIHFTAVFLLTLTKYKRFISKAECLGKHSHNHSYLTGSSVNTELYGSFRLIGINERKDNLISHLIQDACHTQNYQRQRVPKHPFQ